MESRGAAVLGLGQLLTPFGEHQMPEVVAAAAASVPPWRGGGQEEEEEEEEEGDPTAARSHAAAEEHQAGATANDEDSLLELRRRRGRSLSLPASPSLAAARLFSRRRSQESGGDGEGDEDEDEDEDGASGTGGGGGGGCCTKCKKRVQFADSLGLCLASVKHFSAAEEPQVPPAVLSRLQSFPMRQKDLEEFSAALAELGGCASSPPSFARSPPPPLLSQALRLEPSWPEGAGEAPDAERLRGQQVCLEEVAGTALAGVPTDVRGVARVLSCPGPKEVTVRYTFNEWLSFLDSPATALPPPPPPAAADADAFPAAACPVERYQFSLCLPPGLQEGTAVHFAICYRNQKGEHWDNNGGANYTLRGGSSPENPARPLY